MRQFLRLLLVLTVLLVPIVPVEAARATRVDLKGALSKERIIGFGTVAPARAGGHARLTLLQKQSDGWVVLRSKRVELEGARDSDRDGRRDSRFAGSFPSPDSGSCKLRLRVPRNNRADPARASVELPCARPDFPTGTATLISGAPRKEIDVEIADTGTLRAFGLMFKRRLGAERGMAFQFESEQSGGFWMKNTLIPLSIAFYAVDGTIVRIMDMEPCERDPCPIYDPQTNYRGALEVNQGAFDEWGISEGDRIIVTSD